MLKVMLGTLVIGLLTGCASMSSTYNKYQEVRPKAAQSKALQAKALQIKASAEDGGEQIVTLGLDLSKINVSFLEAFNEDRQGFSWAIAKDTAKAAVLAYGLKYLKDEMDGGGRNDNDVNSANPSIIANDGGRISINNAPDTFNSHTVRSNGPNSSVDLNYVPKEEEGVPALFNADGSINTDSFPLR